MEYIQFATPEQEEKFEEEHKLLLSKIPLAEERFENAEKLVTELEAKINAIASKIQNVIQRVERHPVPEAEFPTSRQALNTLIENQLKPLQEKLAQVKEEISKAKPSVETKPEVTPGNIIVSQDEPIVKTPDMVWYEPNPSSNFPQPWQWSEKRKLWMSNIFPVDLNLEKRNISVTKLIEYIPINYVLPFYGKDEGKTQLLRIDLSANISDLKGNIWFVNFDLFQQRSGDPHRNVLGDDAEPLVTINSKESEGNKPRLVRRTAKVDAWVSGDAISLTLGISAIGAQSGILATISNLRANVYMRQSRFIQGDTTPLGQLFSMDTGKQIDIKEDS